MAPTDQPRWWGMSSGIGGSPDVDFSIDACSGVFVAGAWGAETRAVVGRYSATMAVSGHSAQICHEEIEG